MSLIGPVGIFVIMSVTSIQVSPIGQAVILVIKTVEASELTLLFLSVKS